MNLGRLAQTRLNFRNVHMAKSLFRLRCSLSIVAFNIVVDPSRRESVWENVIHLEINSSKEEDENSQIVRLLSLRNVALQDGTAKTRTL